MLSRLRDYCTGFSNFVLLPPYIPSCRSIIDYVILQCLISELGNKNMHLIFVQKSAGVTWPAYVSCEWCGSRCFVKWRKYCNSIYAIVSAVLQLFNEAQRILCVIRIHSTKCAAFYDQRPFHVDFTFSIIIFYFIHISLLKVY